MVDPVKDLLDSKGIKYQVAGRDYLIKCLNPEHIDNNPSLRLDKSFGIGNCFACGFKVNIFKYFGIVTDIQSIRVLRVKQKLDKIYSESVGLSIPKNAVPFTKTFRDISPDTYKWAEAFTSIDWENRLMFPLRDITGKIVVFQGRHMHSDVKPKYIFYPEKVTPPMFPAKPVHHNGVICLVEGIFDALNLIDKGLDNVVAVHGANSMKNNAERLTQLKLQGVTKIYLVFDGDIAGRRAVEELTTILEKANFVVEDIELPEDLDPGAMSAEEVQLLKGLIK